jgi:hypothetical protein
MNMKFRTYREFLNEGYTFDEAKVHNPTQFPWNKELVEKVQTFNETVEFLAKEYNYDQHRSSYPGGHAFEINIKLYDSPDFDELQARYDMTEDQVYTKWDSYVEMMFNDFVDNLDYKLIDDVYAVGRSGGWMALKVSKYNDLDSFVENVDTSLYDYYTETNDFDPITKEDYDKLKSTISAKRIGLLDSNLEKAAEAEAAIGIFKECMSNIESDVKELLSIKEDLATISKQVEEELETVVKGFDDYLKDE